MQHRLKTFYPYGLNEKIFLFHVLILIFLFLFCLYQVAGQVLDTSKELVTSESKELVTSMCTARQEKQLKRAPQCVSSYLLSLNISFAKISTPQYVNEAASVHLSCGRSVLAFIIHMPLCLR